MILSDTSKINRAGIILVVSTVLLIISADTIYNYSEYEDIFNVSLSVLAFIVSLIAAVFFFIFREKIQDKLRILMIILLVPAIILYAIFDFAVRGIDLPSFALYWSISESATLISGGLILFLFLSYLHRSENMLFSMVFIIFLGMALNRYATDTIGYYVAYILSLLCIGYLFITFETLKKEPNWNIKRTLVPFYIVLAACFMILAVKYEISANFYASNKLVKMNNLDSAGVIIYLISCVGLFVVLPFSNFIDWSKSRKDAFKKLIVVPYIFLLIIFSLKFLMPEPSYRKIFFPEYSSKEKIFFNLKDYEVRKDTLD